VSQPTSGIEPSATPVECDRRRRLTGSRRKVLLTVHVVAAVGLLGASIVLLIASAHAATRDDRQEAHATYALLQLVAYSVDVPLALIALLAGVLLALSSTWGIFRYWWVTAKLAILLTTITLGATLVAPSINTLLDVTKTSDVSESSARWRLVSVAAIQLPMLLVAATLGIFKPKGRLRWPRRRLPEAGSQ
jgi:hypothetical protein